jgi:hypothetical protein
LSDLFAAKFELGHASIAKTKLWIRKKAEFLSTHSDPQCGSKEKCVSLVHAETSERSSRELAKNKQAVSTSATKKQKRRGTNANLNKGNPRQANIEQISQFPVQS